MLRKSSLIKFTAAAAFSLALFGCSEVSTSTSSSPSLVEQIPVASQVNKSSLYNLEQATEGFEAGSNLSIRKVYIFFDPQCPHCADLWNETKKLSSYAKFVWIPVALMNNNSAGQGAAILDSEDPVAKMDEHESLLHRNRVGTPPLKSASKELKASIAQNTEVLRKLGVQSIPFVIGSNPLKDEIVSISGGVSAEEFARRFGWSY